MSQLLLLDEATSALDSESEGLVQVRVPWKVVPHCPQDALDSAMQGRTAVTVSHRLPSLVTSDIIYVIHRGQVTCSGFIKEH